MKVIAVAVNAMNFPETIQLTGYTQQDLGIQLCPILNKNGFASVLHSCVNKHDVT